MIESPSDALWSAIAEPSRRRIVDLLVSGGDATASSLATQVPFTRQAVAKHLGVLEEAGLVSRRRQGREVLFRIEPERLDQATDALSQVARAWDRRLRAIKEIAESTYRQGQDR